MLNLFNKEQRNLFFRLQRCDSCISELRTQACKCYDTSDFKRCITLLSRIKALETYRIKLYTIKAWRKVI